MPETGPFDLTHVAFQGRVSRPPRVRVGGVGVRPLPDERVNGHDEPRPDPFVQWLLSSAGIDPRQYRGRALQRRVPACLRALKVASPEAARRYLSAHPEHLEAAVNALLIGVTRFFRDPQVFAELRQFVACLPPGEGGVRAWSAGCSSGEELYSLAILLEEAGLLRDSSLVGTDCRPSAVSRASDGVYSSSAVSDVPQAALERHFSRVPDGWRISERLRRSTRWHVADIASGPPGGPFDIILCRNLTIYMLPDAAAGLMARLVEALRPGGVLVAGKAERPTAAALNRVGHCIYRKPPYDTKPSDAAV